MEETLIGIAGIAGGSMGLVLVLFGLLIGVLWVILPFAVFGIKKRLDAILVELREMNRSQRSQISSTHHLS